MCCQVISLFVIFGSFRCYIAVKCSFFKVFTSSVYYSEPARHITKYRGRDVKRGQMLEAEVEAGAKFNRPSPRPKLKRPNRTLYFRMKIYAIKKLCDH